MAKLIKWIVDAEKKIGESVTHVFLESNEPYGKVSVNDRRLLSRQEFENDEWAGREFYEGFGGPECPSMIAWSPNWILYVAEYDGATGLNRMPRNPEIPTGVLSYGDVLYGDVG